jgi:hypothetical protein
LEHAPWLDISRFGGTKGYSVSEMKYQKSQKNMEWVKFKLEAGSVLTKIRLLNMEEHQTFSHPAKKMKGVLLLL